MVRHIVFFKLNNYSEENCKSFCDLLMSMKGKVSMIKEISATADEIRSGRSFDVVLDTTFDSMEDLAEYQIEPYHKGVIGGYVKENCSDVATVDYSF